MTDQPVEGRVTPPAMMPPATRVRSEDGIVPDRTPANDRSKRPNVCERCGEVIGVVEDHLPNCQRSSAIVGRFLPAENALLEATGSTPIKLMLHADGTVTWRPLYGTTWQEPTTGPGRTEGGGRS